MFGLDNPVVGDQLQLVPPDAFNCAHAPSHIVVSLLAVIVGSGLIVIITLSVAVQLAALLTVTTQVVFTVGQTIGLAILGLDKPVVGDQL